MKTACFCFLFVLIRLIAHSQPPPTDEALVQLTADLNKLTRVTDQRISLKYLYSDLCMELVENGHAREGKKEDVGIHVYVSPTSVEAFKDPRSRFPEGTVILKQKFPTVTAKEADFYAGMIKRERGFNPECGDWEFFTFAKDLQRIAARGRIESCMMCHRHFAKTDYVTRRVK